MRQREKDAIAAKAVRADRAAIQKVICPLCKYGVPVIDGVHPIKIDNQGASGTWIQCRAADVFRLVDNQNAAPQEMLIASNGASGSNPEVASPAVAAPSSQLPQGDADK